MMPRGHLLQTAVYSVNPNYFEGASCPSSTICSTLTIFSQTLPAQDDQRVGADSDVARKRHAVVPARPCRSVERVHDAEVVGVTVDIGVAVHSNEPWSPRRFLARGRKSALIRALPAGA